MEVMKIFITIVVCCLYCDFGQCFIPLIPAAVGLVASGLAGIGYMSYCHFEECCTDEYIPANFDRLNDLLMQNLYGQDLVHGTVLNALRSHVRTNDPKKALAMSFHGSPGTGKNYVSDFIVEALYKKGSNSKYVHNYKGRLHFRSGGLTEKYQVELQKDLIQHLRACPRSIFIFDEVEKIEKGVLDILVPFLDYHPKINGVDPTKAIFIFLSNTGSTKIMNHLLGMWLDGTTRERVRLQHFERLVAVAAFNEKGGFHKSDTIESSLIDHYVPFLPLEENHVRQCAYDAFRKRGVNQPRDKQIEEVMEHLTFGPPPHNLYSTGGCKRLDAKVGHIFYRDKYSGSF